MQASTCTESARRIRRHPRGRHRGGRCARASVSCGLLGSSAGDETCPPSPAVSPIRRGSRRSRNCSPARTPRSTGQRCGGRQDPRRRDPRPSQAACSRRQRDGPRRQSRSPDAHAPDPARRRRPLPARAGYGRPSRSSTSTSRRPTAPPKPRSGSRRAGRTDRPRRRDPVTDGLFFCRSLKSDRRRARSRCDRPLRQRHQRRRGERRPAPRAFLQKPFSPLDLLGLVEQVSGGLFRGPFTLMTDERPEEQILLYARDLRRLLELERGQRHLLKKAYEERSARLPAPRGGRISATGAQLEARGSLRHELHTRARARAARRPPPRVRLPAPRRRQDRDPDSILQKPGSLTREERTVMRTHTVLGAQLLSEVPLLQLRGSA